MVCSRLLNHEDRRLSSVDSIGYRHHIMYSWFVQFDRIKSVPYKLTSVSRGQKRSRFGAARRYTACLHAQNHTKHNTIKPSTRLRRRDFDVDFDCRGRRSIHRFGADGSCFGCRRLGRTARSVARRSPRASCWCRFGHRPYF